MGIGDWGLGIGDWYNKLTILNNNNNKNKFIEIIDYNELYNNLYMIILYKYI